MHAADQGANEGREISCFMIGPIGEGDGQVSLWVSPDDINRTNLTVGCFCEHPDIIRGLGLAGLPILQVP